MRFVSLSSLKQNIETLELRCEELTKQVEEITHNLETEKRKTERLRETATNDSPAVANVSAVSKLRHTSSASEPENEEVRLVICTISDSKLIFFRLGFHTDKSDEVVYELRTELNCSTSIHELLS